MKMSIDDKMEKGNVPAWQDLFSMSYAVLKELSDRHRSVIASEVS
jgi:hypothetical protein